MSAADNDKIHVFLKQKKVQKFDCIFEAHSDIYICTSDAVGKCPFPIQLYFKYLLFLRFESEN